MNKENTPIKKHLSENWKGKKPSPLAYFHDQIMNHFHNYRLRKGDSVEVVVTGKEINEFVRLAKIDLLSEYADMKDLLTKNLDTENAR